MIRVIHPTILKFALWIGLAVSWLLANGVTTVTAQASDFVVTITAPREGETLYAGPTSLVYSIDVIGHVTAQGIEPNQVTIRLDILQGNRISSSSTTHLQDDNSFFFPVTVNPEGSDGGFGPVERAMQCDRCHYLSDIQLPTGHLVLRVTASAPGGRQAIAERRIVVDLSGYATVPVKVEFADESEQSLGKIPVSAATRLYLWRSRQTSVVTDVAGQAMLSIEVLTAAQTIYIFRVERSIVDGVLYEGVAPVTVTLPAGATTVPPITLYVRSRVGQLAGKLNDNLKSPVDIRAIRLPDGTSFKTQTTQGGFIFAKLPIARYLVIADADALAAQGWQTKPQTIDLTESISAQLEIPLKPLEGKTVHRTIRNIESNPIPFVSITDGKVVPTFGEFRLRDVSAATKSLIVGAPGFYSQVVPLTDLPAPLDVTLVRRPETKVKKWGTGEIVIPFESSVIVQNNLLTLERGWVWGHGGDNRLLVLRVGDVQIEIAQGQFALERISGQTAWLYLLEGEARVTRDSQSILMVSRQMLALNNGNNSPIDLDTVVINATHSSEALSLDPVWEPALKARVQNELAGAGIGAVQVLTLVTYSAVIVVLLGLPMLTLVWWRQKITLSGDKKSS